MSSVLPRKRRGPYNIVADILKVAKNGAKKTTLLYQAKLSFNQGNRYLPALKKAGFVTEQDSIWKITEKGLHVLEACELCQRLFRRSHTPR